YRDTAESIEDHGKLLATSGYYTHAMAQRRDPNAFAAALTGVYATDPQYGAKLVSLMQQYDLYRYDSPAPASVSHSHAPQPAAGAAPGPPGGAGPGGGPRPSGCGLTGARRVARAVAVAVSGLVPSPFVPAFARPGPVATSDVQPVTRSRADPGPGVQPVSASV